MRWPILVVLNVVLLIPGVLLAWAWERGALWGRGPGGLCIDIRHTQFQGRSDWSCIRLQPGRIVWEHQKLDPDAPTDFTNGGGVNYTRKFLVFEYQTANIVEASRLKPKIRLVGGMIYAWRAPYWALLLIWAVPAMPCGLAFRREWIRRRRRHRGLCVQCGYDLRASKDRCPECGQVI
jgi:hypothetical protein